MKKKWFISKAYSAYDVAQIEAETKEEALRMREENK